jgi:hypothetical protein
MKPFQQELEQLGLQPNARMLPPSALLFLAEKYCIDIK